MSNKRIRQWQRRFNTVLYDSGRTNTVKWEELNPTDWRKIKGGVMTSLSLGSSRFACIRNQCLTTKNVHQQRSVLPMHARLTTECGTPTRLLLNWRESFAMFADWLVKGCYVSMYKVLRLAVTLLGRQNNLIELIYCFAGYRPIQSRRPPPFALLNATAVRLRRDNTRAT